MRQICARRIVSIRAAGAGASECVEGCIPICVRARARVRVRGVRGRREEIENVEAQILSPSVLSVCVLQHDWNGKYVDG